MVALCHILLSYSGFNTCIIPLGLKEMVALCHSLLSYNRFNTCIIYLGLKEMVDLCHSLLSYNEFNTCIIYIALCHSLLKHMYHPPWIERNGCFVSQLTKL